MRFRKVYLILLIGLSSTTFAQDSSWRRLRINEDLVASIPGEIDSVVNAKKVDNVYSVYTGTYLGSFYMLQFTGKAGFKIKDEGDYDEVLKGVQKGITNVFDKKNIRPLISDTVLHGLRTKAVIAYDSTMGNGMKWQAYLFIANDRIYTVSIIQPFTSPANPQNIQTFINSFSFVKTIPERNLESAGYSFGYKLGELIGALIVAAVIGLTIYFIVRRSEKRVLK
jgi:hypothetical protein